MACAPELDLDQCDEIMVVAAHPDDEALGFGASLATLADRGVRVQVVAASDGGASHDGVGLLARPALERARRTELHCATTVLGIPAPICLGMPDGALGNHEERLADLLTEILAARSERTCIAATWRGDGHPDHEAVGRAAAVAAQRSNAVLLEYPIWMWHWATPGDSAVPWNRLCAVPTTAQARDKRRQPRSATPRRFRWPAPVWRRGCRRFVRRLLAVREVVF